MRSWLFVVVVVVVVVSRLQVVVSAARYEPCEARRAPTGFCTEVEESMESLGSVTRDCARGRTAAACEKINDRCYWHCKDKACFAVHAGCAHWRKVFAGDGGGDRRDEL